eukprot:jgi/Bigna1/75268/fgenesh1_pg.33_\
MVSRTLQQTNHRRVGRVGHASSSPLERMSESVGPRSGAMNPLRASKVCGPPISYRIGSTAFTVPGYKYAGRSKLSHINAWLLRPNSSKTALILYVRIYSLVSKFFINHRINRRRWSRFILPVGGANNPGSWVVEWVKCETVSRAARLDAMERTDRNNNKKTIEVRMEEGGSNEFYPLEPQLDDGVQYKLYFDPEKTRKKRDDEKGVHDRSSKSSSFSHELFRGESQKSHTAFHTIMFGWISFAVLVVGDTPSCSWVTQHNRVVEVILHTYAGSYYHPFGCRPAASFTSPGECLRDLLAHAREEYCQKRRQETDTLRLCQIEKNWVKDVPVPHRLQKHNFIFPDDIKQEAAQMRYMLEDATEFFNSRQWYRQRGIPYRRGYLLHGEPSCGKTFFTRLLAGVIGVPIYVLDISNSVCLEYRQDPYVLGPY